MTTETFLNGIAYMISFVLGDYIFIILGLAVLLTLLYIMVGYFLTK